MNPCACVQWREAVFFNSLNLQVCSEGAFLAKMHRDGRSKRLLLGVKICLDLEEIFIVRIKKIFRPGTQTSPCLIQAEESQVSVLPFS